jgi:hypothetical protein
MSWVLIDGSDGRYTVAFKGEEIGAVCIDALVQDQEIGERKTVFDDEEVAVFFRLDFIILGTIISCAICFVCWDGNGGRGYDGRL